MLIGQNAAKRLIVTVFNVYTGAFEVRLGGDGHRDFDAARADPGWPEGRLEEGWIGHIFLFGFKEALYSYPSP